jgi:spore germination cell wall hydrolase CwlJ-like protein
MKKLLILTLCIILLATSYTNVKAEEGVAGISETLEKADADVIETAFKDLKFTKKEVNVLYKIIEAECEGQSKEDKQNVCSVIINRMMHSHFDNSISAVVFADNQFTSVDNGRYDNAVVDKETKKAVNEVLENGVTNEATYYANLDNVSYKMKRWFYDNLEFLYTDDANHSFFKDKE